MLYACSGTRLPGVEAYGLYFGLSCPDHTGSRELLLPTYTGK